MNCPFCRFPLILPSQHSRADLSDLTTMQHVDVSTTCGTCHAVFTIRLTVEKPCSPDWVTSDRRRMNLTSPATGYCWQCAAVVPLADYINGGLCSDCVTRKKASTVAASGVTSSTVIAPLPFVFRPTS